MTPLTNIWTRSDNKQAQRPRLRNKLFGCQPLSVKRSATFEPLEERRLLTVTAQPITPSGVVNINNDTVGDNDDVSLQLDTTHTLLQVFVGVAETDYIYANVTQINYDPGKGNDSLLIDESNGLIAVPNGIQYDGGSGFNTLTVEQPFSGTPQTSDVYTVGPNNGQGTSVITGSSGTQTVFFQNLAPVQDFVPATTFTINGTPANNAINYTDGEDLAFPESPTFHTAIVTVDNQESMEFAFKAHLIINGLAGDDTINLNNPAIPTSLVDIAVNGGDPTASDVVIVNGNPTSADTIVYSPATFDSGTVSGAQPVPVVINTAEAVVINGLKIGGATNDMLTVLTPRLANTVVLTPGPGVDAGAVRVDSLLPMTYRNLGSAGQVTFADPSATRVDTLIYNGTAGSDTFAVTAAGQVNLNSFVPVLTPGVSDLRLNGLDGDDNFTLTGPLPFTTVTIDGGNPSASDTLNVTAASAINIGLNLANSTITGAGGTISFIGVEVVNLNAVGGTLTVTGTPQNDTMNYTPMGAQAGQFQLQGSNTLFNFTTVAGTFLINGGGGTDDVVVNGTTTRDTITILAPARTATVNSLKTVTLGRDVLTLSALGHSGDDTFIVTPGPGVPNGIDNLLINIDGGDPQASDALFVTATPVPGVGGTTYPALAATQFVVVNKGRDANSGVVRVFESAVADPDITYKNVETVSPNVFVDSLGNPNLLVMGPDGYEPNDFRATAAYLGSAPTLQITNATIFPNNTENPPVPADQDFYQVVAQQTGTLDFQVFFKLFSAALLPAGGQLNIAVVDALGDVIGTAKTTAITPSPTYGVLGTTADARVRIPVVAGQSYYLHVFGANADGTPNATVIAGYNATIVNTPAPLPTNLELSRNITGIAGAAGAPDTGDLPAGAPASDSGRSQFDNVTMVNNPTIYLRLDDANFLQDLPGNQAGGTSSTSATGVPLPGPIPIGFNASTTLVPVGTGYRIALYDGGNGAAGNVAHTNDPNDGTFLGFAQPVAGVAHLYAFTVGSQINAADRLADGLHNITARVQMIDPALPTHQTGFGVRSAVLALTVDTVPPPVSFGVAGVANSGLAADSDSGVTGQTSTFNDRITNDTTPTFYGTAEANAIIKLFAQTSTGGTVLVGQTVAIPIDGTNAYPGGRWTITSTINLNDPTLFTLDGVRHMTVTAEDLAGNVSSAVGPFDIFLDTEGPQITGVGIAGSPNFNLFGLKPTNFAQGPTPLVFGLDINVQDLPANVAAFVRAAIVDGIATTPGGIVLTGESNGVIAIQTITVTDTTPTTGVPTAVIHLTFAKPLPDDRFTLTVHDTAVVDLAGNLLDGESNAMQPNGMPSFPSGNGVPGGDFIASFTVDSRPELGAYGQASVIVDANGNFVWDPNNSDAVNRDLTFALGVSTALKGHISPMGIHDAVFAGQFTSRSIIGTDISPLQATGNGLFDQLGAYGADPVVGAFRWLLDTNSDGVIDTAAGDVVSVQPAGFQISGLPIAGNFDANTANGSEIGLYSAGTWYLDTSHANVIDGRATVVQSNLLGAPVVGDFNGDGTVDLATYKNGVFSINFGTPPAFAGAAPTWSGHVDATIKFGFPGEQALPVAADMDQDGITDLGLFVPGTSAVSGDNGKWYFLMSNDLSHLEDAAGTAVNINTTLNHPFSPTPLGGDIFANFGNQFGLPVVGNFDPPVTSQATPAATDLGGVLGPVHTGGKAVSGQNWYSFTPERSGTVQVTATSAAGSGIVGVSLYGSGVQYMAGSSASAGGQIALGGTITAGQTYFVRVDGSNSSVNVGLALQMDPLKALDVTGDGVVSPLDLAQVVSNLQRNGSHAIDMALANNPDFAMDVNLDGFISPLDLAILVAHLQQSYSSPAAAAVVAAPAASSVNGGAVNFALNAPQVVTTTIATPAVVNVVATPAPTTLTASSASSTSGAAGPSTAVTTASSLSTTSTTRTSLTAPSSSVDSETLGT